MAQQPKRFGNNQADHASIAYFCRVAVGLLWVNLAVAYSALEETPYVPVVTGCIKGLRHTMKYNRCKLFVVVVATVFYCWQFSDSAHFFN